MSNIDLSQLTDEQRKELIKQAKELAKAEKERIKNEKQIAEGLKNELVLSNIGFMIDTRGSVENRMVKMFGDVEAILKIEADLYKNKKEDQDSFSHTLSDGSAFLKIGWNIKPVYNGTEMHGISKLKTFMASLAGESENEKLLMKMLNALLKTDAQGNYNAQKVRMLDGMRNEANSELFNEAMDILRDAVIVIRTSRYVRGWKMVDFGNGMQKRVNFNFSID